MSEKYKAQKTDWLSCAEWDPDLFCDAYGESISVDNHTGKASAEAACRRLDEEGFGGKRRRFPIRTFVVPPIGMGDEYQVTDRDSRKRSDEIMQLAAPIVFTGSVHMVSEDGESWAAAEVEFGMGKLPTEESVNRLVTEAVDMASVQTGKKWRVPTPEEFMHRVLEEMTGQRISVPVESAYSMVKPVEEPEDEEVSDE